MKWSTSNTVNKDSYPIKPSSTSSQFQAFLSIKYRCYKPSTFIFHYHDYSIPNLEKEGYAIRFNDPYEITTKDAPTFHTMFNQTITLEIVPKVTKLDKSLVNEDLET